VSFTGLVTFGSFHGEAVVRAVPSDRYMLETDGPYLSPAPHRGRRNEPAFLTRVRDRVAEIRGVPPSIVEAETTRNAMAFFRLSELA
jgi:TatD DNase family protein